MPKPKKPLNPNIWLTEWEDEPFWFLLFKSDNVN